MYWIIVIQLGPDSKVIIRSDYLSLQINRVMFGDVTVSAHLHKKNHKKPPSVSVSLHEFLEVRDH